MSENYILRVYTKDWAGNVDTNVQMAVFGVDDVRVGSEDGALLMLNFLDANEGSWNFDQLLEPHPDNDEDHAFDANMWYSVAQEPGKDGAGSSYVEFYLDKAKTDAVLDAFIHRLRWLRANDPEGLVGIVDFKMFVQQVVISRVELDID